jgi:hypothetical protein
MSGSFSYISWTFVQDITETLQNNSAWTVETLSFTVWYTVSILLGAAQWHTLVHVRVNNMHCEAKVQYVILWSGWAPTTSVEELHWIHYVCIMVTDFKFDLLHHTSFHQDFNSWKCMLKVASVPQLPWGKINRRNWEIREWRMYISEKSVSSILAYLCQTFIAFSVSTVGTIPLGLFFLILQGTNRPTDVGHLARASSRM